jgi:hypothetical protein
MKKLNVKEKSLKLEKRMAKKINGKIVQGSGNKFWNPSDISFQNYLIETKYTEKDVYYITQKILNKIEQEAFLFMKDPLLIIEFTNSKLINLKNFIIYRAESIEHIEIKRIKIDINTKRSFYKFKDTNIIYCVDFLENFNFNQTTE